MHYMHLVSTLSQNCRSRSLPSVHSSKNTWAPRHEYRKFSVNKPFDFSSGEFKLSALPTDDDDDEGISDVGMEIYIEF